jgi:hypothetical protein
MSGPKPMLPANLSARRWDRKSVHDEIDEDTRFGGQQRE